MKSTKKNTKKVAKIVKKTNKPKASKKTAKSNKTKKSTSKAGKKTVKQPTKKQTTKKVSSKTAIKKTNKATKKTNWDNITITESGEIIDKNEVDESESCEMCGSNGYDSSDNFEEETGVFDENGDWNGSTRSDQAIAKETNPQKRKLLKEIDELQEEIRRARENDEDDYYIAGMVQDIRMKEGLLNEITIKEQWGDK